MAGFVAELAFMTMDPTYGLSLLAPEHYSRLGTALLDMLSLIPFIVILPVWVLRASTRAGQRVGLLAMPAVSLLLMVLILALYPFALQNIPGDYPLGPALVYNFTVGPRIAAVFWAIFAAIVLIYWFIGRYTVVIDSKTLRLRSVRS